MSATVLMATLVLSVLVACTHGQLLASDFATNPKLERDPADSFVLQTKQPPRTTAPPYVPPEETKYPPRTTPYVPPEETTRRYPPPTTPYVPPKETTRRYPPPTTPYVPPEETTRGYPPSTPYVPPEETTRGYPPSTPYVPPTTTPPYPPSSPPTPYVPPSPYPTEIYPYDPYEPYDPYDPYPFYFCELNEDEYGRPYYGPYDEYRPPYIPPPPQYPPEEPTQYPTQPPPYYVRPLTTTALPPRESYDVDVDTLAGREKRQVLALPSCVTSNECRERKERCEGYGTRYDRCGRRCTCRNGLLEDCCRVRKEWRSMTQVERCRYVRVVFIASTQQPWKRCYDDLIQIHRDNFGAGIHGINFFLPWHRWYILALENLLRQIDCRVTVPYWDWSLQANSWQNSIIWAAQCGLGGDGVAANGNQVGTGPFRGGAWQLTPSANNGNLRRNFNGDIPNCAAVATGQRAGIAEFNSWHVFISSTLHDSVHCRIGGTMCSVDSANAPEFFLHHGFIDKLWLDWQNRGPAFKNLPFYANNANPMNGAFGYSPRTVYDLNNQPGCVRVCVEQPARPCRTNTTYTPVCPTEMNCNDYSPIKLANLIQRPYPRVPEEAYELFNTPYENRRVANRYHQLFNDYDRLYNLLENNGYAGQGRSSRPSNGDIQFDRYLYQPEPNDPYLPPPPDECRPYFPPYN